MKGALDRFRFEDTLFNFQVCTAHKENYVRSFALNLKADRYGGCVGSFNGDSIVTMGEFGQGQRIPRTIGVTPVTINRAVI